MNILDMLSKELKNKDWTLEEKARYLYIRCCELFTYDPRYKFCNYIANGEKLKQEILNQKINLENVTDNWVVCTSHINEVYIKLLKLLLNIDARAEKLNKNSVHTWAEFNDGTNDIKADSAIKACPDLTKIKMKLKTQEYHPKKETPEYWIKLHEIDKKIGYIKDQYQNYYLEVLKQQIEQESNRFESEDEKLLYKWLCVVKELKKQENTEFPINLQTVLNYLILHLLTKDEISKINRKEYFQFTANSDWVFATIYEINLTQEKKYYIQPRFKNQFNLYEINKQETEYYERKMIYPNKR